MGRPDNYFHTRDILAIPFVAILAHRPDEGKIAKKESTQSGRKTRKRTLCKEINSIFRITFIIRNYEAGFVNQPAGGVLFGK